MKQLSLVTGLPRQTIYYYEKLGLITGVKRSKLNYRLFPEETIARILLIKHCQELGFSLSKASDLIASLELSDDQKEINIIATQQKKTKTQIRQLKEVTEKLSEYLRDLNSENSVEKVIRKMRKKAGKDSFNILLVDDDDLLLETLVESLRLQSNHTILAKNDPELALKALDHFKPHIVATDYRMQPMNGLDLVQSIKSRGIVIPTILISGDRIEPDIEKHFNHVIQKPFSTKSPLNHIDQLLAP